LSIYKELRPAIYKHVKAGMSIEDAVNAAMADKTSQYFGY